jgi:acetylornithine deacetylase/succinyl-diaminopimelate desuccinylase-like protein
MIVYRVEPETWTKNIMVYGHLDKQPYDEAWEEGLSPTEPVIRGTRLYGRGSHDDGYAAFSTMLAIKAAQMRNAPLPRICLVLETEEESGSPNLIDLLELSKDFVGKPDCLFCMDSGCLDYERLWITSSLRGNCRANLEVEAAKGGYHSGEVGGIVPETFSIVRALLDRLDDK